MDVGHDLDGNEGANDGRLSLNEFKSAISQWMREGESTLNQAETPYDHTAREVGNQTNKNTGGSEDKVSNTRGNIRDHNRQKDFNDIESFVILDSNINKKVKENLLDDEHKKKNLLENKENLEKENNEHQPQHHNLDDEEEDEEHYLHLTDTQLMIKACLLVLLGTGLVFIFSHPMVDVITNFGKRLDISPFYISFVVTPLALNASEIYHSILLTKKKTKQSISLHLLLVNGSATKISTLALGIFMSLVYLRELAWIFSAEIITVLLVIYITGLNSLSTTIKLWQALLVGLMYPLSILIVYLLDNQIGLRD